MKIYVHSTAPWSPSSYSVLTNRTLPNMFRDGHSITLGTWYGLQGQPLPWGIPDKNDKKGGSITVLPSMTAGGFALENLLPSYQYFEADCLITISDVWVFPKQHTSKTVFCPWLPIDHDPAPLPVLESLESAVYPMVYSKWGKEVLAKNNIKAHYVPCSAPSEVFKPGSKEQARKELRFPIDAQYVVSMVSANKDPQDRKGFSEGLLGFARFAESVKGVYLYLHTQWDGAVDIKAIIRDLKLEDKVIQPDPFALSMGMLNDHYMAQVYRASDVLLNTCKGEGFGLPLVEAQMCGCPVAVTDFATTDELLFAGWKIAGQPDWSNGLNSWRITVYIDSVVNALEEAYKNRDNEKLQQKAHNGAIRFDNDTVFNQYWRPALKEIEAIVNKGKAVFQVAEKIEALAA